MEQEQHALRAKVCAEARQNGIVRYGLLIMLLADLDARHEAQLRVELQRLQQAIGAKYLSMSDCPHPPVGADTVLKLQQANMRELFDSLWERVLARLQLATEEVVATRAIRTQPDTFVRRNVLGDDELHSRKQLQLSRGQTLVHTSNVCPEPIPPLGATGAILEGLLERLIVDIVGASALGLAEELAVLHRTERTTSGCKPDVTEHDNCKR